MGRVIDGSRGHFATVSPIWGSPFWSFGYHFGSLGGHWEPFWEPWGSFLERFGRHLGTLSDHVCIFGRVVSKNIPDPDCLPPFLSPNGPKLLQKGPKGVLWVRFGSLRKATWAFLPPPIWRSRKKLRSLLGALGARCTFFPCKNACRQKGPLGSKGALGGVFGTLGRPSGRFSRFRGVAGASRFASWGAQGPPEDRFKNSKSVSGGPFRASVYEFPR